MKKQILVFLTVCCFWAALLSGCAYSGSSTPQTEPESEITSGWQEIDGARHYFRCDGTQVTGWLTLEEQKYYLDADGCAVSGPLEVDGALYIFDENGSLTTGWTEVDDTRYCADANGHPLSGWLEADDGRYFLDETGAAVTGWLEWEGHTYYMTEDGAAATGRLEIDGSVHAFAFNGQELLLVNPWNYLPEDYTVELTGIGGGHRIADCAYDDFAEMMADCEAAGLYPVVRSSFRTMTDQEYLYQRRIDRFVAQGYSVEEATEKAGTIVAIPGTSEHQLGLALDIVDSRNQNLDESQAEMPTQQWLMENSWRYGWILRYPEDSSESTGIIYEPWHYRYVGREIAADIHASGLCLEDYLQMLTDA